MDEREYTFDDAYISLTDSAGAFTGTTNIDEIMKKSVIDEKFANLKQLPVTRKSRRKKKPVEAELPEEVEQDLKVLKMRNALDPKRFYKRGAIKGIKKNVQIGVVLDSPADFYNSRLPKKLRKPTLVDELLSDAKFKKDIKRRYVQIITQDKHKFKHKYTKYNKKKNFKSSS